MFDPQVATHLEIRTNKFLKERMQRQYSTLYYAILTQIINPSPMIFPDLKFIPPPKNIPLPLPSTLEFWQGSCTYSMLYVSASMWQTKTNREARCQINTLLQNNRSKGMSFRRQRDSNVSMILSLQSTEVGIQGLFYQKDKTRKVRPCL